jgi:hypothetical protein
MKVKHVGSASLSMLGDNARDEDHAEGEFGFLILKAAQKLNTVHCKRKLIG